MKQVPTPQARAAPKAYSGDCSDLPLNINITEVGRIPGARVATDRRVYPQARNDAGPFSVLGHIDMSVVRTGCGVVRNTLVLIPDRIVRGNKVDPVWVVEALVIQIQAHPVGTSLPLC